MTTWVGLVSPSEGDFAIRQVACQTGDACQTRAVAGGTVYLDAHAVTADERRSLGRPEAGRWWT